MTTTNVPDLADRFQAIRLQHQVVAISDHGIQHCACGLQLGLRTEAPAQHLEELYAALALGIADEDLTTTVFVQWKGTDICVDIYCPCGANLHFDGYFLYAFECGKCHAKWDMPQRPALLPFSGLHRPELIPDEEDRDG